MTASRDVQPGDREDKIRRRFASLVRLLPLLHLLQMIGMLLPGSGVQPRRRPRATTPIAAFLAFVLLTAAACRPERPAQRKAAAPPVPAADVGLVGGDIVSYAATATRLEGMDPGEVQEQIRDWARAGLASLLGLDTPTFRDAFYDTPPIRDPVFSDLADQPSGPGRSLYDGKDMLHLLVPSDDRYPDRTIGQLLDDFRTDSGADPAQVTIHWYRVDQQHQLVGMIADDPEPAATTRIDHGYVEERIDTPDELKAFLGRTESLSRLEDRDGQIWAGGWHWPGIPSSRLTPEDVSVIQRGYLEPSGYLPGFSLDPGPVKTADDIRAVAPDASDRVVDLVLQAKGRQLDPAGDLGGAIWKGLTGDSSTEELAARGLPSDRAQLWSLFYGATYSRARYLGPLKGTEVGMTLFYTDMVAKDWSTGVGKGVPDKAVPGFVPDAAASIPPGHCPPMPESGRLWFGQNESGFSFSDQQVSIGSHATRLFARSNSENGSEVEPSYAFGRGLRWWDQHFQEIADYEPQYHRLDQIMRWSSALEWLVVARQAKLAPLSDDKIRSGLTFQKWYDAHDELKERSEIRFVGPPSAGEEAILAKPSQTFSQCDPHWRFVEGGVSLGNLVDLKGGRAYSAELPPALSRAGPIDESSTFDAVTGTGQATWMTFEGAEAKPSLQRSFSTREGRAVVETSGPGKKVQGLGTLKIVRSETATRKLTSELEAGGGRASHRVSVDGEELGEQVTSAREVHTATVEWRRGPKERLNRMGRSILDQVTKGTPVEAATPADGALLSYEDAPGHLAFRTGGRSWVGIFGGEAPPGEATIVRLRGPDRDGPSLEIRPVAHPMLTSEWMDVYPTRGPPRIAEAGPPDGTGTHMPVTTPDGGSFDVYIHGDHLKVRRDDALVGMDGEAAGSALLRHVPEIRAALEKAASDPAPPSSVPGPVLHSVRLDDDGVVFVQAARPGQPGQPGQPERVILAPAGHPWSNRWLQASGHLQPTRDLTFVADGPQLLQVINETLTPAGPPSLMSLEQALKMGGEVHVDPSLRSELATIPGVMIPAPVPRTLQVVVVPARGPASDAALPPDIRISRDPTGRTDTWFRLSPSMGGSGTVGRPPTSPNPGPNGGPGGGKGPAKLPGVFVPLRLSLICEAGESQSPRATPTTTDASPQSVFCGSVG